MLAHPVEAVANQGLRMPRLGARTYALVALFALALAGHWRFSRTTLAAALLSPFVVYLLLHGQVDALVLLFVLLPRWTWVAAALGKPQAAAGLAVESLRDRRGWVLLVALLLLVVA